jgi:uncharacterized protein (DUF983 family)
MPARDGSRSRSAAAAMRHGFAGRCPACGHGGLFGAYLKVEERCRVCGEELHHHRADDAPAYFTMFIVGHVVVGGLLSFEQNFAPPTWVQLAIWLPAAFVMSLALLPRVKGLLVGLQWALRMHGFATASTAPSRVAEGRPPSTAEAEYWRQ